MDVALCAETLAARAKAAMVVKKRILYVIVIRKCGGIQRFEGGTGALKECSSNEYVQQKRALRRV